MNTDRLKALTDAIFAITMTLLVLEVKLPELGPSDPLFPALVHTWPQVASFIISFIVLGNFWSAHNFVFSLVKKLDNALIWTNIAYLLLISFVPFSAALLGSHYDQALAVVVYGLVLLVAVAIHVSTWWLAQKHNLLFEDQSSQTINFAIRLGYIQIAGYALGALAGVFNPTLSLIIYALILLPFIFGWFYKTNQDAAGPTLFWVSSMSAIFQASWLAEPAASAAR